ncbi:hypothetical protein [Rhizomonospora bruguierae]|uniref:hypothetical protein n=1 Tax=Rhizomonospora bruguierae TaxID=1581705 RepID=UPI001BCE7717|nr:hypothetical protein [Micromonospora sp. NBRC 107566]
MLGVVTGVAALLIGMSVAPELSPGDTLQVKPRSVAGATSTATSSGSPGAWAQAGTCDPPLGSGDDAPTVASAVLPPRVHPEPAGYVVALPAAVTRTPSSHAPLTPGCRGPPASTAH